SIDSLSGHTYPLECAGLPTAAGKLLLDDYQQRTSARELRIAMSAIAQTRSGIQRRLGNHRKGEYMTDEKQDPKQQSGQQPQQENKQPFGQQQDRKPGQGVQQQ